MCRLRSALRLPPVALAALLLALPPAARAQDPGAERAADALSADVLRAHLDFLADDLLEGRAPGTRGGALTERYLAAQLRRLGLPVTLQPVELLAMRAGRTTIAARRGGGERTLCDGLADCVLLPNGADSALALTAPAVFAGFGIVAPAEGHDDYAGLEVRGRIVVALGGSPGALDSSRFRAQGPVAYGGRDHKAAEAERRGAVALILIHVDRLAGYSWAELRAAYVEPGYELVADGPLRTAGYVDQRVGAALLAALGPLDSLAAAAARPGFRGRPLGDTLRLAVRTGVRRVTAHNVVARLDGTGPRAAEGVIVGAHHDHLGIGPAVAGDSIYNGALDNASGTAGLLTLAEALVRSGVRPARTIWFVGFTAEEAGFFGSRAFVADSPVPPGRMAAMFNIDGLDLFAPARDIWAIGGELSTLGATFAAAARAEGRTAAIPEAERRELERLRLFFRSDHLSFARAGVPAIFLWGGYDAAGRPPGWKRAQLDRFLSRHYHQPSDEIAGWFDPRAAIADLRVLARAVLAVAGAPAVPAWRPGSGFARP